MTYHVRTGHGELEGSYGGTREIFFQGTCQGNGASPAYWLSISMIMVLLMHKRGHATSIKYPITREQLKCMGFLFVDDTELIVIGKSNDSKEQVCIKQQQGVRSLEQALQFTGGALKSTKCYCYLIDFSWHQGVWKYAQTERTVCRIQGEYERVYKIVSYPLSEANKTMGLWQNLMGDNVKQTEELIAKHLPIINKLSTTNIPRNIFWKGFLGILWASVRYGMSTYALSVKESSRISSKLFRPLFQLMGVHQKFLTTAATFPPQYLGLGIPGLLIKCGIERIKIFITNMG